MQKGLGDVGFPGESWGRAGVLFPSSAGEACGRSCFRERTFGAGRGVPRFSCISLRFAPEFFARAEEFRRCAEGRRAIVAEFCAERTEGGVD